MPSPTRTSHRLAGVTALAVAVAVALPSLAAAATVEVREQAGSENRATLEYRGDPGGNHVTVAIANPTEASSFYEVKLSDKAGIEAGPHCSGSGAPEATITCMLHRPTGGWTTSFEAPLGAGNNVFDARQFTVAGSEVIRTHISSGAGKDEILTGNTYDLIEPGAGNDEVRSGDGNDAVLAAATPDGSDVLDLGGGFDQVSYARRSEPVSSDGVSAGGAGERDQLIGVDALIGGSGNDSLVGSETTRTLDGGPGDDTLAGGEEVDTLFGGPGNDTLEGGNGNDTLEGDSGNDTMIGGNGDDNIKEDLQEDEADHLWVSPALKASPSDGADFADGGAGGDLIELGPGDDRGLGGSGGDLMRGGSGNDELDGGEGDDGVFGESGADRLIGGAGFDEILAGRVQEPRFDSIRPADTDRDVIDCGPDKDVVLLNRWDRETGCEFVRTIRIVEPHTVKRNVKRGTARLTVTVVGPGTLASAGGPIGRFGRKVKTASPEARTPVVVPLAPSGAAKRALAQRGHVIVHFWLRYRPLGGVARSEPFAVKLVGPPPPRKPPRK